MAKDLLVRARVEIEYEYFICANDPAHAAYMARCDMALSYGERATVHDLTVVDAHDTDTVVYENGATIEEACYWRNWNEEEDDAK